MTNQGKRTCECAEGTGLDGCKAAATWMVGVGTRVSDRQLSCGRHLNRVCWAMVAGEAPRNPSLTITPLGEWTPLLGGVGG